MSGGVCAFTSVCADDEYWFGRYLTETRRLGLPFAVHLDRCTAAIRRRFHRQPNCVGITEQPDPAVEFAETHKQRVFDLVRSRGFAWALAWDVDETWGRDAAAKIGDATRLDADQLLARWVNLWGDERHVRTDGPFASSWRVKLYRLSADLSWRWYDPKVNGPRGEYAGGVARGAYGWRRTPGREATAARADLVCVHWGMMTRELRQLHKARWDRVYGAHGGNPYGFWNYALDEENCPARVSEHDYF